MTSSLPVLLGNSGSPRWYAGPDHDFDSYLDLLAQCGATSTEIVLHHGPYDERTARVHVVEPDWLNTVAAYQRRGVAVQLHVSLNQRFATSRWRDDRDGLEREYEPVLTLADAIAGAQDRIALVLHGASDPRVDQETNEDTTAGLLDWLTNAFERRSLPVCVALELGAAKPGRENASARSRASVLRILRRVESRYAGICWDLAHDCENARVEEGWTPAPDEGFLRRVVHVHLHDLDDQGVAHYPLLLGTVPIATQLGELARVRAIPALTMEIRWILASRMGDPWDLLAQSYDSVWHVLRQTQSGKD